MIGSLQRVAHVPVVICVYRILRISEECLIWAFLVPVVSERKVIVSQIVSDYMFFPSVFRNRMSLNANQAFYLIINNKSVASMSTTLAEIYKDDKDEDGFLYMTYASQEMFGWFQSNLLTCIYFTFPVMYYLWNTVLLKCIDFLVCTVSNFCSVLCTVLCTCTFVSKQNACYVLTISHFQHANKSVFVNCLLPQKSICFF